MRKNRTSLGQTSGLSLGRRISLNSGESFGFPAQLRYAEWCQSQQRDGRWRRRGGGDDERRRRPAADLRYRTADLRDHTAETARGGDGEMGVSEYGGIGVSESQPEGVTVYRSIGVSESRPLLRSCSYSDTPLPRYPVTPLPRYSVTPLLRYFFQSGRRQRTADHRSYAAELWNREVDQR